MCNSSQIICNCTGRCEGRNCLCYLNSTTCANLCHPRRDDSLLHDCSSLYPLAGDSESENSDFDTTDSDFTSHSILDSIVVREENILGRGNRVAQSRQSLGDRVCEEILDEEASLIVIARELNLPTLSTICEACEESALISRIERHGDFIKDLMRRYNILPVYTVFTQSREVGNRHRMGLRDIQRQVRISRSGYYGEAHAFVAPLILEDFTHSHGTHLCRRMIQIEERNQEGPHILIEVVTPSLLQVFIVEDMEIGYEDARDILLDPIAKDYGKLVSERQLVRKRARYS
jgi:hypothetical protein